MSVSTALLVQLAHLSKNFFPLGPNFSLSHFFTQSTFSQGPPFTTFSLSQSHSVHFFTRPTFTTKYSPLKRNEYCKSSKSIYKYYLKLFHSGAHFSLGLLFTQLLFHPAILFTQPTFSLGHFNIDYSPLKLYRMLQIIKFCL